MLTDEGAIKCDYCGRFISYDDLMEDRACHRLDAPDSEFTREEWESWHYKCKPKHITGEH